MPYNRPKYYQEIDERFNKLEDRQREFRDVQDNMQVNQAEQMKKIDEIHYLLAGTEYEKNNGGLIGIINKLANDVKINTNWRIRVVAAGSAIAGLVGFLLVKATSIWKTIKELTN